MFERLELFAVPEFVLFLAQQGLSKSADAEVFDRFVPQISQIAPKAHETLETLTRPPTRDSNILSTDVAFGQGLHKAESTWVRLKGYGD